MENLKQSTKIRRRGGVCNSTPVGTMLYVYTESVPYRLYFDWRNYEMWITMNVVPGWHPFVHIPPSHAYVTASAIGVPRHSGRLSSPRDTPQSTEGRTGTVQATLPSQAAATVLRTSESPAPRLQAGLRRQPSAHVPVGSPNEANTTRMVLLRLKDLVLSC